MFGNNPVRKVDHNEAGSLVVQDVFRTIQGEGPFAGIRAVFVRLAGCNLRCHFCNTDFESNYKQGKVSNRELVERIAEYPETLVVFTGGEPLRQNIVAVVAELTLTHRKHVQVETAGTVWLPGLDTIGGPGFVVDPTSGPPEEGKLSFVISPKTPALAYEFHRLPAAWKYIIADGELDIFDGLPNKSTQSIGARALIARPPLHIPRSRVFVQPRDDDETLGRGSTKKNIKAAVWSAHTFGYRLSLQQHKILGLP